ncbi:MAG: hypothetical protein V5A55_04885 [Halovenus sp.]
MLEQWRGQTPRIDRRDFLERGVLPAVATVTAMAGGFTVVGVVLFVREPIIVDRLFTQILALAVMYLLPQFVAGLWIGRRNGVAVAPPIAAGVAPVFVVAVALGLFGGPIATPLQNPGVTVVAVAVWSGVFACGMFVGAAALGPADTGRDSEDADRDSNR